MPHKLADSVLTHRIQSFKMEIGIEEIVDYFFSPENVVSTEVLLELGEGGRVQVNAKSS